MEEGEDDDGLAQKRRQEEAADHGDQRRVLWQPRRHPVGVERIGARLSRDCRLGRWRSTWDPGHAPAHVEGAHDQHQHPGPPLRKGARLGRAAGGQDAGLPLPKDDVEHAGARGERHQEGRDAQLVVCALGWVEGGGEERTVSLPAFLPSWYARGWHAVRFVALSVRPWVVRCVP